MKSLSILIPGLFISILCISATAPRPSVAFIEQGDFVKVFYKGEAEENITIAIYDAQDNRVFKETICRVNGFSKPYNLSQLPEGEYQLRVYAGHKLLNSIVHDRRPREVVAVKPVEVIAKVTRLSGSRGKYILSIPRRKGDELQLHVLSLDKKVVYQKKLGVHDDTAVILNLAALKGVYVLEVTSKNKTKNSFRLDNQ
jgi:hypothetical protein